MFPVDKIIVNGGNRLGGEISVHGAKNSSLPILAATLLAEGECVIHNCPELTDVQAACDILEYLGCSVKKEGNTLIVDSSVVNRWDIPEGLMHEMRSSIVFLGPILSRMRKARLYTPGGCEIGLRPIDLHLSSLKMLGADISESHGELICLAEKGFSGSNITLSFPSVGATENIILACAISEGTTNIFNAAREPEIADLADFLNKCGARITTGADGTVTVEGVRRLHGCEHTIIPDRITAATYMSAVATAGGEVLIKDIIPMHMKPVISVFEQSGCRLDVGKSSIRVKRKERLRPVRNVRTMPYPGFPTDAQAPVMAMTALADGTSVIVENIFESRFKHVPQLVRLGSVIKIEGRVALIDGVEKLYGAKVCAPDLRGGSALVVAALAAEGTSEISGTNHIDRGYEKIEESLRKIGADIRRGV